jgi:hypothetical protein
MRADAPGRESEVRPLPGDWSFAQYGRLRLMLVDGFR